MKVTLPNNTYGRFTAFEFSELEISNLSQGLDYSFFVSNKKYPINSNLEVIEKQSAWVKILENEEDQISTYQATCRNEVRRSLKSNELSIEINTTPLETLFHFHKQCETERNWFPIPPQELASSLVVCVRYLDELIAGMTAYYYKDFLRVGRIFSSRKSLKYQDLQQVVFSSASRRIVNELTRWGFKNGFQWLDLGGVTLDEENKSGITKFKLSFGSEIMPIYLGRKIGSDFKGLNEYCKSNNFDLT
jgi:hypothetical protein